MKTGEHPTSFGVFSPVGHVVVSLPQGADVAALRIELDAAGFGPASIQALSATDMLAQADGDLAQASPLAAIGQDLNLVKAQRELALLGHSFLVIEAAGDEQAAAIGPIVERYGASRAQHYGRWVVEELIDVGSESVQVNESADTGLDAQTPSGKQGETSFKQS